MTFLLSISQVLVFFVYLAKERFIKNHRPQSNSQVLYQENFETEDEPKSVNKRLFAIPAILDGIENVLKNISLTMISGSIVQMLRSSVMLYCALLAMIFLKKRLYRHHWTSMAVIAIGVVLIGTAYLLNDDKQAGSYSTKDVIIGLVLL